jgi:hypothetical protein
MQVSDCIKQTIRSIYILALPIKSIGVSDERSRIVLGVVYYLVGVRSHARGATWSMSPEGMGSTPGELGQEEYRCYGAAGAA